MVTLVIEKLDGTRVRNLVSETPFPAGDNAAWWDGLDDLARDTDAARHGVYQIPARFVEPGEYRVRGLAHAPVHLRYEFSVYNAGSPAWETQDSRGGWLANHTPPSAVLFVPESDANQGPAAPCPGGTILAGSYVSEGGHGLAWLDLDGRKHYGQMWIGGVWTGASHLARDAGSQRVAGVYAYAASAWEGGGFDGPKAELRLAELVTQAEQASAPRDGRFGKGWDRPLLKPNAPYQGILPGGQKEAAGGDLRYTFPDNKHVGVSGLAVWNAKLVASLPKMNQLLWVDAAKRKTLGTTDLQDPRGVAFDSGGRLLVLSGTRLLRYDIGENLPLLGTPKVLVAEGLDDPQGITLSNAGEIYVSDWGKSHQVKVFSPEGQFLRSIGNPGEPKAGFYDPVHMNHPKGLTIDSQNRLWVAEEDFQPKRVSVWSIDGKLAKAFYGPSEYGGGGRLDPKDKSRFYYYGMEFQLDWERGTDQLKSVFFRAAPGDLPLPNGYGAGGMPEMPIHANGRQYMTNCYNSNPTNGSPIAMIWIMEDGKTRPVAALGRANDWKVLKAEALRSKWPEGVDLNGDYWRNQAMFVWSDLNGNGQLEAEEVTFCKARVGGVTVLPDLSVVVSRVDDRVVRYRPTGFTDKAVPTYDILKGETLLSDAQDPASSGGDQALVSDDGWTITTVAPKPFARESMGGGRDGKAIWSYPSLWPGLHASHESPAPDRPGMLVGTTRLLGGIVRPGKGEAGPLWCINGNMGNMYLFTADGLFVSELFRDVRLGKSWTMPQAERGMLLDDVSLHDENFWPTITQTSDGLIYLVDGARSSIVRVDGLESVRRLPAMPITVTADDLRLAQAWHLQQEAERQRSKGSGVLEVMLRRDPIQVDGKLDEWAKAQWVTVDDRGTRAYFNSDSKPYSVKAAIAVSGDRLYAAFKTGDANLLKNAGDAIAPFKTGGALDLMLGTASNADGNRRQPVEGDQRLLITRVGQKVLAVHYRAVVPGTKQPVGFSSPWRTITLDEVKDVSDQVQLGSAEGDYELSVPLALMGLKPQPGMSIRGDIGVLRGNGFQTLQRVYWNNKATGITSDVPSEAELCPWLWGQIRFKAENQ
ncbi:MAG: NHL repeat-containing protein [Bacillota bacterium]